MIPTPRPSEQRHWCPQCRECDSCQGGRDTLPRDWVPVIAPTGAARAVCTQCWGAAVLCPTLAGQVTT